jgi:acyl-CoA synthetase (AMP-forming)/AMP-acid ligase II
MEVPKLNSYWQYVEYWSSVDPSFPALRENDRTVTSREFEEITDQLAKVFISLGVKKGDRIVTILPSGINYVFTLIAAGKVSAILVPLDVKFRMADLQRFLSHADPRVLIALPKVGDFDVVQMLNALGPEFNGIKKILVGSSEFETSFEDLLTMPLKLDEELKAAKADQDKDDGALIIFTGGTTGVPKAALLSHENMALMSHIEGDYFNKFLEPFGITGRYKTIAALPPSHVGGTIELIGVPIVIGLEMLLFHSWSPTQYLDVVEREKIPFVGGVPTMFAIMLSLPNLNKYDLSSVKLALLSGEKVSLELVEGTKAKIADIVINGYGSTEAGAETNFTEPDDDPAKIAEGYAGKPLPTVKIRIVDDDDNPLPPGQVGEVIIGGPLAIKSYFKMPEEDKVGFTSDGWVRMGDYGYLDKDGGLYIQGRKKQIIRVGSYTVLPTEVEDVVIKDPNVSMAAAIGVPDKIYGEVIWLFVIPESGKTVDEAGILEMCKRELAKFKVPEKVIVRKNLPTTRIGKVDRVLLRKEVIKSLKESF